MLERWKPQTSTISRWDPFSELLDMRCEMDQLFGSFFGGTPATMAAAEGVWAPAVDIHETKDGFVVEAELPGMKQDDIQITIVEDTLTLKGERKSEREVREEGYTRVERAYGTFQRALALPSVVDSTKVRAKYKDGVLTIELPKKEEARPREIKVQVS
jgi:HSP20 family protein